VSRRHSGIALAAAAIEAYEDEEEIARQRLLATAHGGPPAGYSTRPSPPARSQAPRRLLPGERGPQSGTSASFRVGISADGDVHPADADLERFDSYGGQITVNGAASTRLITSTNGPIHLVEVDGVTPPGQPRRRGCHPLPPRPALVVRDAGSPWATRVEANAPVLVLESMKMETVLPLAVPGPGAGAAGLGRQPGGDGRGAAAPGAAGRRQRGAGGGPARARSAEIDLPAQPAGESAASPRRAWPAGPAQPAARLRRSTPPGPGARTLAGLPSPAARAELGRARPSADR